MHEALTSSACPTSLEERGRDFQDVGLQDRLRALELGLVVLLAGERPEEALHRRLHPVRAQVGYVRTCREQEHATVVVPELRAEHQRRHFAAVLDVCVHAVLDEPPDVPQVVLPRGHAHGVQGLGRDRQAFRSEQGPEVAVVEHHPALVVGDGVVEPPPLQRL
eukprot:CAMPEP_0179321948 /NCGR_PEP_ID=MMETSP0797-20121207/58912_1 /TAXON_ID=47934 /ORGANISM="Dinophysis acuminata, Strain DAEP01" /LENGTH=162 /DNA_ID=CAMNT_0021033663 /DNA_START=52 /DNA_END=538 /DNA_ORIENTATION=+